MSVRHKLFLAMSSIILLMGLLFAFLTQSVIWGILRSQLDVDRRHEVTELADRLLAAYEENGRSWETADRVNELPAPDTIGGHKQASYAITSSAGGMIVFRGPLAPQQVRRLGQQQPLYSADGASFRLHYSDEEVASRAIVRAGIGSSVTVFLLGGGILLALLALVIAYRLSAKLTAPLHALLPAIERLGRGEPGVQAPVTSKDEYGQVALAFNQMSDRIRRAEDARKNLVADVAHELRTPLTIARGKLEWIQQSGQAVEPEQLLPLQDELLRLTRLVDELHQLSLAEARRLTLERRPVAMVELLERSLERIRMEAEDKELLLTLNVPPSPVPTLWADPHRLAQVFLNLLANAIRYTPQGGSVTVTVNLLRSPDADLLQVAVADSGIGIEEQHLSSLFDRFYRTDEARNRNSGGMGIGLAIAREFVLLHKGTLEVASSPGKGSTFTVTLPYMTPPMSP
ncbi:two-component system, OmpR family, sensor histidine kinase BaeS [Paenibacillus sp. UNCCL117]|uniref:sensor histidine kinase n=1 Tax=unclassified Paenibacillus TaxID=185978 RepID=UPI00087E9BDB|nr:MULTISPECIES: ATP-binding protein [unclassified Paenibacillus]SDC74458.1 two-component system, OmpR family, sensor histidine kinase BaeS [Paenibacillus sp. cl123]SFW25239.1 two-component system, OmpR family, sensor histidine kinase BaeS [Paenibacillus sp. UNCCL117]